MGLIARILRRTRVAICDACGEVYTTSHPDDGTPFYCDPDCLHNQWKQGGWRHPNGTDLDCPWCAAMGNRGRR